MLYISVCLKLKVKIFFFYLKKQHFCICNDNWSLHLIEFTILFREGVIGSVRLSSLFCGFYTIAVLLWPIRSEKLRERWNVFGLALKKKKTIENELVTE